ncbi:MAG: tape measure protein [Comamonas sp.]|uniref:tape measure protein n=1 Tax=Comamonas sp. TaxID=34028 RepID=UPI002FCC2803
MLTGKSNLLKFILSADSSQLQREIEKSQRTVTGFVDQLMGSFGRLGTVVKMASGLFAGGALLKYADDWGQLSSRVDIATGSIQAGSDAMDRLMSMSSRVYKSISDTSELFIRTSGSLDQLGYSSDEALTMVEALSYGLVVSSATGEKTKSVIDAWSKSVLNGKMGLSEFQSVTAGAPRLLRAMADSLGMSERELLKFVASGQMTVEKLMLVTGEVEKLGAEADKMPTTVADAGTRLGNALTGWAGKFNEVSGATSKVTDGINAISAGIQATGQVMADNKGVIGATLGALTGAGVAAGALAVGSAIMGAGGPMAAIAAVRLAFLALTATMAANPAGLVLLGVGAAAGMAIAANSANPQGDRLEKEISNQEKRLKEAEDLLARAGGSKGKMTERLEARIEGIKTYVSELKVQREAELGIETKATDAIAKLTKEEIKAAEIEQDLADIRRGLTGVSKDYLPTLEKLHKYFQEGRLTQEEYVAMVQDLAKANYKAEGSSKSGAAAVKALQGKYQELSKGILEKTEALTLELAIGSRVSESDKLRIKFQQDLKGSLKGLSAAQRVHIADLMAEHEKQERAINARKQAIRQYEQQLELEKELAEEYVKQSKARQAMRVGVARANQELEDQEKRMALEVRLIGATTAARETGLAALDAEIELRKELDAINSDLDVDEPTRIEARAAAAARAARKIALAQQRVYVTEAEKTSQTISQTLQDYIMGGGKDAATYLKRLFSTLVLQPVVQYGVQGALGMLGMGGSDSSGGSVGGVLGGINNMSSLYSAFSGGLVSSVGGAIGSLGAAFGSSAITSFAAGMKGASLAAGVAGPTTAGASGAMGLGATFGAALPWVAGGLAVINLLGGLGKQVTPHAGAASEYQVGNLIGGNAQTAQNLVNAGDSYIKEMQAPMDNLVLAIGSSFDALAKNYGKTSGYSVGAGFTSDNNDKSAGFFHLITPDGQTLDKWTISRKDQHYKDRGGMYDSDSAKGFDEYLKDVAFASLRGVGDLVPKWASKMATDVQASLAEASGADSITAFQNLVMQIAAIEAGFTSLGTVMPMFVGITDDMKGALLGLFGTMDNLTAATSSFYGLLYSEQERMNAAGNQVNTALKAMGIFSDRGGLDVFGGDAAKVQLRQAVEELMAAGNAELAGQLMAMTQSFVTVADYAAKSAQEAAKAAIDAYNTARDAAFANLEAAVARERSYWDGIASAAQTAVSSLSSTLNLLTSNARDLYGTVDATQQMLAAQGMVYIEDALAGVRGGASASSYSGLQDAITAARGGISGGRYASQFEKDRDALVLAGQLSQLGDLTDIQLSVEERALKAAQAQVDQLDKTLEYWRELIVGSKDGNLSVVEAINRLAQAMGVTASGPGGLLGGGGASFGGGSGAAGATGTAGAADPESFKYIRDTWLYDNHYARRGTNDAALDPLADLMRSFSGSKDSFAMLSAARDAGYRLTDVQAASTAVDGVWRASTYEQWLQEANRVGLPAFAEGGFHAGGLRVVGERGWEVEATGPSRIWNQQQIAHALGGGNSGNAELVTEIRALREDNRAQAGQIVRLNARVAKLLERWEGGGVPRQRREAAV